MSNDWWSTQNEPDEAVIADCPRTLKLYLLLRSGVWKSKRSRERWSRVSRPA